MYLASQKRDIGKQELHSLLTGSYIQISIKMKQDIWQLLNDKWSRPIDKDGIVLGQYGLIVHCLCKTALRVFFSSY